MLLFSKSPNCWSLDYQVKTAALQLSIHHLTLLHIAVRRRIVCPPAAEHLASC